MWWGDSRTRTENFDRAGYQERGVEGAPPRRSSRRTHTGIPQNVYIVKRNDTFGSIAGKTGVPVDRLQELNPAVDPQTLHEGQKIKLR